MSFCNLHSRVKNYAMKSNTLQGCDENTEAASDCERTTNYAEDAELNTKPASNSAGDAELFHWLPLLSVMNKTREKKKTNFLFRAKGVVNRWAKVDKADKITEELLQYDNPVFKSVLRDIKRVLLQPKLTEADKQRLHDYKIQHQNDQKPGEKCVSDKGVDFAFKLLVADEEAKESAAKDPAAKFVVRYASDPIPYDQVMAITYAWHESANKKEYKIAREVFTKDGEDSIKLRLGVEWDVDAVLETLAVLSKDYWIWMDQFSLNQDVVKTKTLATDIPSIYRNARVVAFLPYRVCDILLSRIKKFRGDVSDVNKKLGVNEEPDANKNPDSDDPDVSKALAEVMFHDLVCNCTDGLYGWLSRMWTWQELMLASSLRFVWGLGESEWVRIGYCGDLQPKVVKGKGKEPPQRQEEGNDKKHSLLESMEPQVVEEEVKKPPQRQELLKEGGKEKKHLLFRLCEFAGKTAADFLKDSVATLSVSDQPITKLMNELTKRNTESLIVSKSESATLSMGYYFCMRLLCGAEVFMPSASRTEPINCLKVLQQIAHTGRKGGNMYDCYYAALAFIDVDPFLPNKKISTAERKLPDYMGDFNKEAALRKAYIELYEREHAIRQLPDQERAIVDDPDKLSKACAALFDSQVSQEPDDSNNETLRQAYVDHYYLYKEHKTTLIKHTGYPVPYKKEKGNDVERGGQFLDFHPIGWQYHKGSSRHLESMGESLEEKGLLAKFLFHILAPIPMEGNLPNAFVLSGLNEDAFCETKDGGDNFSGTAYDILSIKRIKVGRKHDLCFNSIRKIAKYLHPSQLARMRNFISIPSGLRLALFPLAYGIIHATSFKIDPYPTHFLKIFLAFLGSRTTKHYVDAVTMLLDENFNFLYEKDDDTFELAKITFADGTCCVGVISRQMKDVIKKDFANSKDLVIKKDFKDTEGLAIKKSTAFGLMASAVKIVKTHKRLLLCGGVLSGWSVVGYIPGFDAEANEAVLGPVSHSDVDFKRVSVATDVPQFLTPMRYMTRY